MDDKNKNTEIKAQIEQHLIGKNVKVRDNEGHFFKTTVAGVSSEWVFFKKGNKTSMMRLDKIDCIIERNPDESNGQPPKPGEEVKEGGGQ